MSKIDLNQVLSKFNVDSKIEEYGNGHINDTYRTTLNDCILQRINTNVFKDPEKMMDNISEVTEFLREKIKAEGGDPDRETLTVIKTCDGKSCYRVDDDNVFRVYKFIDGTKTVEEGTKEDLYRAGQGFGRFQRLLGDFPAETLSETIADFHNTPKRVRDLEEAVRADIAGRAASVREEIEFVRKCASFASVVTDGLGDGSIPLRVTHNDTKINNILFDEETGKAICVIDLDTVMPGSALYDFGDALRIGASTAAEDETDLDAVSFDTEIFESFAKGYFSEMGSQLTEREIELLPFSAKLLTFECGARFLTDYLNGDTYFKIHREHHNLERARNQFKLVKDIAEKEEILKEIIAKLINK
ncbi:MAG: aminoglycoside phosphotransferase family protein [Clostridia bacterium]|nr:aminoglycoside phosphotransferase family protein [Clostridia bacterium]